LQLLFFAHSDPRNPNDLSQWEPLFTPDCPALSGERCEACERMDRKHGHLNKVAWWTGKFTEEMFRNGSLEAEAAREWGYIAGLWHDIGKFAPTWQNYLRSKADIHCDEVSGRVDHARAGAQHAVRSDILGHLLAYCIAGHHSGPLDAISEKACLQKRLEKEIASYANTPPEILARPIPDLPRTIAESIRTPFVAALFTRMIFSALVDADFLATEAFMASDRGGLRRREDATLLRRMLDLLEHRIAEFPFPQNEVDRARANVHAECVSSAEQAPGLFSLTVPTGGGKTLSSLAFALRHAIKYRQRRVIYVIPFTSIIEQNTAVFDEVFRPLIQSERDPIVLQHHSNLSPQKETERTRLAAENWDAPLVVTTAVQFYESLHAARTSQCRKLHNIANSVVILDEAQCLPVEYLRPCLDNLRELAAHYNTTVLLCTATQPAVHRTDNFPIGLEEVREIVPNPTELYETLKRVKVVDRGPLNDATLASEIAALDQVLAIVNTRRHAQSLFRLLPDSDANFHLSALMCPAHRDKVFTTARSRLRKK
jgi:CRISPR-associated endonuclease/helicase Cas3